jgi:hypothetical protein
MSFPATLTRNDMEAFDTQDLLPLRQLVHAAHAGTTGLGSQSLLDGLSRRGRFRILRYGPGAQVLARNGLALAEAQLVLRQAYGTSIDFGTPTIHRVIDHASGRILVPMMFLRVDAPRAFRHELLQIFAERSTRPGQVDVQRHRVRVCMESPLARLIGVERQILECTDGAADVLCWLARYGHAADGGSQGTPS